VTPPLTHSLSLSNTLTHVRTHACTHTGGKGGVGAAGDVGGVGGNGGDGGHPHRGGRGGLQPKETYVYTKEAYEYTKETYKYTKETCIETNALCAWRYMHVRVGAYLNVYTHIHLSICAHLCACACMMMIAFMTMNSGLVPLIEGPCAQILYLRSEIIGGMRSHICGGDCPPCPKHEYAAKVCTVSKAVMGTAHLI